MRVVIEVQNHKKFGLLYKNILFFWHSLFTYHMYSKYKIALHIRHSPFTFFSFMESMYTYYFKLCAGL